MKCKETSGILFSHACDQLGAMSCTTCNKPICERHMRHVADKPTCISCARKNLQDDRTQGRNPSTYMQDPYFFHYYGNSGGAYNDNDFELFEGGAEAEGAYSMDDAGAWAGS